jgi:hypothetical protein
LIETNAIERLSRFVVGLGAAARPETRELAAAVIDLARGALDQALAAVAKPGEAPAVGEREAGRLRSDV